jgi:phage gpG-like protein
MEVLGRPIVKRRLLRFAAHMQDASLAFGRIAKMLDFAVQRQFDTEGAYGGEPWAPLADSTLRSKPAGLKILVRTGKLKGSFRTRKVLPDLLEWGSDVAYGVYHMKGTSRMPARPPVKLPEKLKIAIVKELQREIVGRL